MPLFYISFATDEGFRGATVVEANTETGALRRATELKLNPGGQAAILEIPENFPARSMAEMLSYKDRLVGKEELLRNGAIRKGDLPEDVQDRVEDAATVVCEDCNR